MGDGQCTKCPLLQNAKVISSHVQACCAGAGALVHLDVSGPSGSGECTFNVMKMNGGLDANMGRCHAN